MEKHHFIIMRHCPLEQIFDGFMTFPEAHKFMDEHATSECSVSYKVYNDKLCKWEDFKDSYIGSRKVYDCKGTLKVLDLDYRHMKVYACSFRTRMQSSVIV